MDAGRRKRRRGAIPVFVVEQHHEALQKLHYCIRRRHCGFSGISVVHCDAHPDLTIPADMPADLCRQPKELYAALDESPGGIAEWLLPAAFAGHLDRVLWLKPPWARQIADGRERVTVGRERGTGRLRVASELAYFLDDGVCAGSDGLEDPRTFQLDVASVPSPGAEAAAAAAAAAAAPYRRGHWWLDICLDFFACENPFAGTLAAAVGGSEESAALVRRIFARPRYRSGPRGTAAGDRRRERQELADALREERSPGALSERLQRLYGAADRGAVAPFAALFCGLSDEQRRSVLGVGHCANLPAHEATRGEMAAALAALERALSASDGAAAPPAFVTVARSVEDGYCPRQHAAWLQDQVLQMLRRLYGEDALDVEIGEYDVLEAAPVPGAGGEGRGGASSGGRAARVHA